MDPQAQFCPNFGCPARGRLGEKNIVIHSRKEKRFKCRVCGKTFTATKNTVFYWLRHEEEVVVRVVTLLAYGCPVQAIVAAFGLDERSVMSWEERAGKHCQQVHEQLVQQPRDLEHVQADEIRVKAQKKVLWLAMAMMVSTRLWLGAVVSPRRDTWLIIQLIRMVRLCALARPLLFCVDGFKAYVSAIRCVFRSPLPSGKRGRPHLITWPDIHIGQMIKQYQGKFVIGVLRRMAQGRLDMAQALITRSKAGTNINTAFIERLNATFRSRIASLARRSRALLRNTDSLQPLVYLMGTVYNFGTYHQSLRLEGLIGGHKWIERTPAIAAGITDHLWTVEELLLYRIPPPTWQPPVHPGRRSAAEKALIARWCP